MFKMCLSVFMGGQKKLSFHRPISSIHHNPNFTKTCKIHRRVSQPPSAHITSDEVITRRVGNHHPNLWDYEFIQSLPKSYLAPSYCKRAEELIKEVKRMFKALSQNTSSLDDIYKRLSMVDDVERLGIDHHFQSEIKSALDYVYRYWDVSNGVGCGRESSCVDLNTTALGFRILRLHRYNVSEGALVQFKHNDGQYLHSIIKSNEELRSILNLYRASLIVFPKEKALDDVNFFTTTYLKQYLPNIDNINLQREIKFNLDYDWYTNVPRLEARTYIDIYGDVRNTNNIFDLKLLELAKLDFNIIQSVQQQEIQILSRWWIESGLAELEISRHRYVEFYFIAAVACVNPEYSTFRIGFAKMCSFLTCLDDIYDTYGTLDELKPFTQSIKSWGLKSMEGLPQYMKVAFKAFDEGLRSMAREVKIAQRRDTLDHAHKVWENFIDSSMKEASWIAMRYIPSLEEYLENGKVSCGFQVVTLQPILSLDIYISDDLIQEIYYRSKFIDLICLAFRVRNDIKTFKVEADRKELASCITCYLKENHKSIEKDAFVYFNSLMDEKLKELNWEYLKPDNVPPLIKDHTYALSKGIQLIYKYRDGISVASIETKDLITKTIIEPIAL